MSVRCTASFANRIARRRFVCQVSGCGHAYTLKDHVEHHVHRKHPETLTKGSSCSPSTSIAN